MDDQSLFRQKGPGQVPIGQDQEAIDSNPSEQSGTNVRIGTPVWRSFVQNKAFQEANQGAIQAEQSQLRAAQVGNRRAASQQDQPEVWKGANGKLIRKVGRQSEMLDAEGFVDHPTAGPEARKSLWDREIRTAKKEAEDASFTLKNPAFHAKSRTDKRVEDIKLELDGMARAIGPAYEADPKYKALKQELIDDDEYRKTKTELAQKSYDSEARARQLESTDPEAWWQSRPQPTERERRASTVADGQAQIAEAQAADQSAADEESSIRAELAQGVKGSDVAAKQARLAEISAARGRIAQEQVKSGKQIEQVKNDAAKQLANQDEAKHRGIAAKFIGTGNSAVRLTGDQKNGFYDSVKGDMNEVGSPEGVLSTALKSSNGDIDKAIAMLETPKEQMGVMEAFGVPFTGSEKTSVNPVDTQAAARLREMKGELDAAGVDPKDRPRIIQDAAKATAWSAKDSDNIRTLSTGEIAINPGRVFGQRDSLIAEINASGSSDADKQAAIRSLDNMRTAMADQVENDTYAGDSGFAKFSQQKAEQGITDKVALLDEWSKLQKDRNWLFKAGDAVKVGLQSGSIGVYKTGVGTAAGVSALVGADGTAASLGKTQEMLSSAIGDVRKAGSQRGLTGAYGITSDLTDTVTQMAPMLIGGHVSQGLKGISQVAVGGMSVYGWAAAQGYESKLNDAVDMAREKKGSDLTDKEISAVLGDRKTQVAGFLNGFQTAILAKVLSGGSERAALGKLAESMTVRDFLGKGGAAALRDGVFKQEVKAMAKTIFEDAADESIEEFTNQVLDGAISTLALGKDMKLGDLLEESFKAGAMGGLVGGGLPQLNRGERSGHAPTETTTPNPLDPDTVATALAAIDPEAEPPAPEEIQLGSIIAPDAPAEGVLIERELSAVEAEDINAESAAEVDLMNAQATGDKVAIKAAETAMEKIKAGGKRAPTVRATLKIASGQQLDDLTDSELRAVGYKSDGDSFKPMTAAEMKDAGITAPLIRSGVDGSIILTDGALKKVGEISTRARGRVKMSESEAIQKAKERAATLATPEASGQATEAPAGSSSPASQSFDVPMRDGTTLRVSAPDGAKALEEAAAQAPIAGQPAKAVKEKSAGAEKSSSAAPESTKTNEKPSKSAQPSKTLADGTEPNHNGAFPKEKAEAIQYRGKKAGATIHVAQLANGKWIASGEFGHKQGTMTGMGGPLDSTRQIASREVAIATEAMSIMRHNEGIAADTSPDTTDAQREEARKIVEWARDLIATNMPDQVLPDAKAKPAPAKSEPGKQALALARKQIERVKKNKRLAAALIEGTERAIARPDGIVINPEKIIQEAIKSGMNEVNAGKYFNRVLDEEIRHLAQFDAAKLLFQASGQKGDFKKWMDSHYAGIWQAEFVDAGKADIARTLYAGEDAAQLAAWDALSDGDKALEAIRMMSQGDKVTEAAKLWANIGDSLRTALKAALAALRKFSDIASPTLQQEITNLENALKSLTGKPRGGNSKTGGQKPTTIDPGDGTRGKAEVERTGSAAVDGGTEQARRDGAGSPLVVGSKVEFERGGKRVTGVVALLMNGHARVRPDSNPAISFAVKEDALTVLAAPADLKGEKINKEWVAYSEESHSLGIPRAEMPQIHSTDRSAMVQFLKARGIDYVEEDVLPDSLKPTQLEYSPAKVQKAREHVGGNRALLISDDGHLVDGHHQWMAALDEPTTPIRVIRLMAPIREILSTVAEMPSVETADGSTDKTTDMKSEEAPASQAMEGNSVDTSSETKAPTTDEAIDNFAKNTRANLAAFEAETKRLHAEQSSAAETPTEAAAEVKGEMVNPENRRPAKEIKAEIIAQVEAEIAKLPTFDHEFVNDVQRGFAEEQYFRDSKEPVFTTFSIPGDGTFKIHRTTKDLGELLARVKRMPVDTKERAPSKSFPKTTLTKDAPIKHADIILGLQDPDYRKQIVKRLGEQETTSREEIALRSEGVTREELSGQAPAQADEPAVNPIVAAIEAKRDAFKPGPEAQAILDGRESPDDIAREEWRNAPLDPDAFGGANYPLVESQESSDETPAAEVAKPTPKPRKPKSDKGPSRMELLENYFTVGKLLPNGDRVLDFATGEDGRFEVKVIREGEEGSRERTHSTEPDNKTLIRAWKDRETTPEVAPAAEAITDFGEKIGGARKDRWKDRGLVSDDLGEMTAEERHSYVTKGHVFGYFDYESMVDDGMPSEIAWLVKKIKDKVALVPDIPGKQAGESHEQHIGRVKELQGKYVELVGRIRDSLKVARSLDDINGVFNSIFPAPTDGSRRFGFDSKAANNVNASLIGDNHLIRAMQVGPYDLSSAKREVAKSGWPSKADSWKKKFAVRPKFKGSDIYENGQKVGVTESDSWYVITNAKRGWGQVVGKDFATEDDAINFAKEQGSKGSAGGTKITRPYNPDLKRTGPAVERGENVTEQDFSDAFGFRGGEFGKWTNAADRQQSLNQAYDGLMDLARVLGIPSKALSLNGALGIAFGARGGGKASAHYEPSKVVINLTKTRGAGTLAHEWAHAVDDHFGKIATGKAANYLSHAPRPGEVRPEVMKAWAEVMKSITTRQASTEATVAAATVEREKSVRNIKSWFRDIDTQVAKIADETAVESIKGDMAVLTLGSFAQDKTSPDEIVSRISAALKANGQKGVDAETRKGIVGNATWLERRNANLEKAIAGEISRQEDTDILAWSKKQGKSADNYWARLHELFARSFESYVAQTLEDSGETSPYLVQGVPTKNKAFPEWEGAYPLGRDAVAIHQAFKGLFDVVESVPTEKGVSLRASELPMPEFREAANLKEAIVAAREFVNQPITNLDDGLVATASGNAITKMISQSAAGKSVSVTAHAFAIANLDRLFANSIRTHSGPDERGDSNLAAVHRYYAPFMTPDGVVLAKMTVKEFARESEGNRIYSVEAVDVVKPAGNWVASISEDRRNYTPQAGFEEKMRQKMAEIKGESGLQASPLPEPEPQNLDTFKKRAKANFDAKKPLVDNAKEQLEAFGSGVLGTNPKFANHGSTPKARDVFDTTRVIDSHLREIRRDQDVFQQGLEYLEKHPEDVERLIYENGFSTNAERIDDYKQYAIKVFLDRKAAQASGDAELAEVYALSFADIIAGREMARAFRQRHDHYANPAERALAQISDAIFMPSKDVIEQARAIDNPQARRDFVKKAGERRVKQVRERLEKELGIRLEQVTGKNRELQLANSKLIRENLKLKNQIEVDVVKLVQKGWSKADIARRYDKQTAEKAQEIINRTRAEIGAKLREMLQSGMSREQIREVMKDGLRASGLSVESAMAPDDINALVEAMLEDDFGLPKVIPDRPLPRSKQPNAPKPPKTSPIEADWSRPEFTDGLQSYTFDTTDRANIMRLVETIRSLAQGVGSIRSLEGEKRVKADAALAKVNAVLAKYGTDAEAIFKSGLPLNSYRFDPSDVVQVAAVIRVINAMDADWIDKGMEYAYGSMLSGTQTAAVNALAGIHAVHSATLGRGVELVINSFLKDPMSAQWGEVKYVLRALAPAWSRAWSNMIATFKAQHPMFERDVLGMEIDWDAHLGGALNRTKTGVIGGRLGNYVRAPMRFLAAVDDFNKTLFGMSEAAAFAYRLAVKDGLKPESKEFERFIRIQVNTPGSTSYRLAAEKAAQWIFANSLPTQKGYTDEVKKVRDLGDIAGWGAASLNKFVTSTDQTNMTAKFFQALMRMSFFPFQRTPFNIIRQGARYTPNPVSWIDISAAVIDNLSVKNAATGKREFGWNSKHRGAEIIERMGQQLQGAAALMLLMATGAGEGDEDDDKKLFLITGSQPWSPLRRAEIEARRRAGVEAYRVSLRRKDGAEIAGFSYGRIEPYATAVSATIDTLAAYKRGMRAGEDVSGIVSNALGSLVDQAKDKTFMKGLGDLVDMVENMRTAEEFREPNDRKVKQFLASRVAMLIPNIVKQPIREADTRYRERTDSVMTELLYQMFPSGQKPAKIDPYGNEETKRGSSLGRMFDPLDIGTKKDVNPIDRMLIKYRDSGRWAKHPDPDKRKPWFPSPILKGEFTHRKTGKSVEMDSSQLQEFKEMAGKRFKVLIGGQKLNFDTPSPLDVEIVRKATSQARTEAKKLLGYKYSQ